MKRTALKRKTPLKAKTQLKPSTSRKCANCGATFTPFDTVTRWCSPKCGVQLAMERVPGSKQSKQRTFRMKKNFNWNDKKWLKREAQKACNRYIKLRDRRQPCISCGKPLDHSKPLTIHAGHYKTRGAHSVLALHPWNIHSQHAHCNQFDPEHLIGYRVNLIERIGVEAVEFLEKDHGAQKWVVEEYQQVLIWYRSEISRMGFKLNHQADERFLPYF